MIYHWRQIFILGFYKRKSDVWASTSEILFQTTFLPPPQPHQPQVISGIPVRILQFYLLSAFILLSNNVLYELIIM